MRVMTRPQHTKREVAVVSATRRSSLLFLVKSFFKMSFYEWTHTTISIITLSYWSEAGVFFVSDEATFFTPDVSRFYWGLFSFSVVTLFNRFSRIALLNQE